MFCVLAGFSLKRTKNPRFEVCGHILAMEDDAIGIQVCGEWRANTGDVDLNIYSVDVWGTLIEELKEIGIGFRPLRTGVATIVANVSGADEAGGEKFVVVKFKIGVL